MNFNLFIKVKRGGGGIQVHVYVFLQSWKAKATNRMYSSDLTAFGKKCCYFFLFHFDI